MTQDEINRAFVVCLKALRKEVKNLRRAVFDENGYENGHLLIAFEEDLVRVEDHLKGRPLP